MSRPSRRAWTRTCGTPRRAASSASATRCRSWAWTPPGPIRPDDRQPPARRLRAIAGLDERRPLEERAVGDRGIDPRQILEDRPAGAEVEVAHLGVAHLAGRQARPPRRMPRGRSGASGQGDRARRACSRPGSRRRPGRARCRTRRGRPGRWDAAAPAIRRTGRRARCARPPSGPARATMPAISSGLSDAPPTRAPSIDGSARNSSMLAGGDAPAVEDRHVRGAAGHAEPGERAAGSRRPSPRHPHRARSGPSRSPRPARRRSSATEGRSSVPRSARSAPSRQPSSWAATTASARPASRSASCSPTHRIVRSPAARAARSFRPMSSSLSPASRRRSEWPTMTQVARPASIDAAISPV